MAVDILDLAEHLGGVDVARYSAELERALGAALGAVEGELVVKLEDMSQNQTDVFDQATLTVAGDIWRRKDSPGGIFALVDGFDSTGRLPYDSVAPVRAMMLRAGLYPVAVVA